ncbi:4Fe-4S ferredoxin iron-sulfur binding domain protein [Denitrovibrio acetiphilus DSM 12809]|uniref:4Fe-4S ferredoxin iron-sulfur binding domain protein n=1 Tax=Denitrovibrio acetiphilus (strain DSM 12809 / NBRC 114555 / N2460) TaxID=522772 RepID=D4H2H0_DENA2|nr:4Fe-4S binding protein [Denitrovibrio acetiphilus]ADD67031.1 4Fe-4S ferredoxin iron-sulfur binding domain protein [Denitrovibrio acetiphilus DSM 12809]
MAHLTAKRGYSELAERLNRFPQGAPASDTLFKILSILMTEKEAALIAQIPIKPFKAKEAAEIWKMSELDARKQLDALCDRALIIDIIENGEMTYVLPPPMAGFFEFSMMRTRGDIDQHLLGQLFYQYMNVEEDFIKNLFVNGETQLGRVFVNEDVLSEDNNLYVYDYERATEVIKTASHIGVSMCYCRHKMQHMGKACDAPMDICMTFNNVGASLIRHGYARQIDAAECTDLLDKAYEHNLVQFGENSKTEVSFICNCCGCCCEALIAARKFGIMNPVHTSFFLPEIDAAKCTGCGKCAELCPVESMAMVSANDPAKPKKKLAKLDESTCLGCGVCLRGCKTDALKLKTREKRIITPETGVHKVVMMAVERGGLEHLIFDNRALFSHRALAAVIGAILKLPPVKRMMATEQVKSRYLLKLIEKSEAKQK